MADMPEPVYRMVVHPDTNKVLTTVSPEGEPHSIICGSLTAAASDTIAVAEVYMYRTAANLESNPAAEILVWKGREAYSIKVEAVERIESGPILEKMARDLEKMHMKVVAVWLFRVTGIWDEGIGNLTGSQVVRWTWQAGPAYPNILR